MRYPLFILLPTVSALYDCAHGFVGRIQASIDNSFFRVNETRSCQAAFCIRVNIFEATDDDGVLHQGVSSRCAYTGGDRETCVKAKGCTPRTYYDGMKGNFSFCCCQEHNCNKPTMEEVHEVYGSRGLLEAAKHGSINFQNIIILPVLFLISI